MLLLHLSTARRLLALFLVFFLATYPCMSLLSRIVKGVGRRSIRTLSVTMHSANTVSQAAALRTSHTSPIERYRLTSMRMHSKGSNHVVAEDQVADVEAEDAFTYSTGEEININHLLSSESTKSYIHPYWINQLKQLQRPVARSLVQKLNPNNALGYEPVTGPPRKGTLLENIVQWKKQHADKVILTRVGEFYESYGIDALMLINYAGLNAMAGAPKAGCPIRNIQQTLDALTEVGLSVAVYEEIAEVESSRSPVSASTKAKMKSRVLSQIVSPASRTYIYQDMCLRSEEIEFRENRPAVGILRTVQGYTLCQIHLDTALMRVSERLTEEGVRALLAASGYIEPVYLQDCSAADLPFLQSALTGTTSVGGGSSGGSAGTEKLSGYKESDFPDQVLRRVSRRLEIPVDNVRLSYRNAYQQALPAGTTNRAGSEPLMPIYTSTALQIGLIPNENVPDLIPHLLPQRSGAYIGRFLRKWLLNPPPAEVADQMRQLCAALLQLTSGAEQSYSAAGINIGDGSGGSGSEPSVETVTSSSCTSTASTSSTAGVPRFTPMSIAKVVTLINAHQCNVALFREIRHNVDALQQMLRQHQLHALGAGAELVPPLLVLTSYESGIRADGVQLLQETAEVLDKIDYVIPLDGIGNSVNDIAHSDWNRRIPDEFFQDNEAAFRNKVLPTHPEVAAAYAEVHAAAQALCDTVMAQFPEGYVVQYDINNNAIVLRNELVPGRAKDRSKAPVEPLQTKSFEQFVDRKGKTAGRAYTTPAVSAALQRYQDAAQAASVQVAQVLQGLSAALQGRHLISIVQAAHWAVILESATLHAASSRQKGWALPKMIDFPTNDPAGSEHPALDLHGLSPYWMDRATCTLNPVQLKGIYLLTAPNMSGKSTLMRSVLVAALLANCGLCVPCDQAVVPRYDHYFLRTASYDVPSEAKSAFALEVDDVRVMVRDCTHRSLVMIDELGKGTSAKDGSALSGALLEHLDQRRISGIFATHLHELFSLPLLLQTVTDKKMGFILDEETGRISWNYHLEDGRCTDSMALVTARKYGIDASIVQRAEQLAQQFDAYCRPEGSPTAAPTRDGVAMSSAATPLHPAANMAQKTDIFPQETSHTVTTKTAAREISWADATHPAGRRYHLATDVVPLVRSLAGVTPEPVHIVPAAFDPPVGLEGSSCVYVLQLYSLTKEFLPDLLYVGETESVRQRLQQHRERYRAQGYSFNAAVVAVTDKSAARRLETTLIQVLKDHGFDIENDSDSRHVLFGRK